MKSTKIALALSATMYIVTPSFADYAYCKTYDSAKSTFNFTSVFYTSTSSHDKVEGRDGRPFADTYNTYPGKGATCRTRSSKSKVKQLQKSDIRQEKKWAKIRVHHWPN